MARQLNTEDTNYVSSDDVTLWQAGRTEEGLANQQTGTDEEYLTLDFTPIFDGVVYVDASGICSHNSTGDNLRIKILINDSLASPIVEKFIQNLESKDSGGAGKTVNVLQGGLIIGSVNSGTDNEASFSRKVAHNVTAGVTYTFSLAWNCQSGGDEGCILEAALGYFKFD